MFEKEFEKMLLYYNDVIQTRSRFSGLVKDYFPGKPKEINLILSAYDLGIAQDIEKTNNINNAFAFRFVKRLTEEYGISRINADWAVSIWCVCYGQHILHKPCEIQLSSEKKGSSPAIQTEKPKSTAYGDLFQYERSSLGNGLAVTGFSGVNKRTIIFQNYVNGQSIVEVKESAFMETDVEEVILTEGYRKIGNKAFLGCHNLRQIIFPISLHEIGDSSFAECRKLKSIALPECLQQIGTYGLAGTGIKTVQIPGSLYYIGEGVLSFCKELKQIVIPPNIVELPDKIFYECSNLEKVELSEELYAIGDQAFMNCRSLQTIYIPDSVRRIGNDVFSGTHEKFVLQCSMGSEAEEYARKHKIQYQLV